MEPTKDLPRRIRMDLWCPAEKAIYDAVRAVENMPADTRLTDAVCLLAKARDRVADFVDGIAPEQECACDTAKDAAVRAAIAK